MNRGDNPSGFLVIRTARSEDAINEAVVNGYWPLIRKVEPSRLIQFKYCILQHRITGQIRVLGDYRDTQNDGWESEGIYKDYDTVVDWTFFYPYIFPTPFAAYLIPKNLAPGTMVFIEDLIEDHLDYVNHSQQTAARLQSAEAIWNGSDFEFLRGNYFSETIICG